MLADLITKSTSLSSLFEVLRAGVRWTGIFSSERMKEDWDNGMLQSDNFYERRRGKLSNSSLHFMKMLGLKMFSAWWLRSFQVILLKPSIRSYLTIHFKVNFFFSLEILFFHDDFNDMYILYKSIGMTRKLSSSMLKFDFFVLVSVKNIWNIVFY